MVVGGVTMWFELCCSLGLLIVFMFRLTDYRLLGLIDFVLLR